MVGAFSYALIQEVESASLTLAMPTPIPKIAPVTRNVSSETVTSAIAIPIAPTTLKNVLTWPPPLQARRSGYMPFMYCPTSLDQT